MRYLNRMTLALPAVLAMLVFSAAPFRALAQDHDGHKGPDHGGMHHDDKKAGDMAQPGAAEMEAMMKAGTPGPEHKEMMKSAGTWDAEVKFNMGTQWSEPMKGTMKIEPLFDGRYMMMKFEGVMNMGMGDMPFKGIGITGYDNIRKKYFSTWFDSMSTSMMKTEGTKQGNVITLTGTMTDPMTGKDCDVREVATHTDDNHMTYEMYGPGPDGKEMKMMEIKYTRKM